MQEVNLEKVKKIGIGALISVLTFLLLLIGFGPLRDCKTSQLACENWVSHLEETIAATRSPIVLVTEVTTELRVTELVTREVEVTRIVTPAPPPTLMSYPECSEVSPPPCVHVARADDSPWAIALRYLRDGCRWPEIMNVNRDPDGYYSPISTGNGYFIPLNPLSHLPSLLSEADVPIPVVGCEIDAHGRLVSAYPCLYTIPADRPIYNGNYDEVARRFYADVSLGEDIRLANLVSGCNSAGEAGGELVAVDLGAGEMIVLPAPRR
jgi:hypothetical protein